MTVYMAERLLPACHKCYNRHEMGRFHASEAIRLDRQFQVKLLVQDSVMLLQTGQGGTQQ